MRRRTAVLLSTVVLAAAACGADDDATSDDGGTGDAGALSAYDDVGALASALDDAGLTCDLEYEGLDDGDREVSLCNVEGEFTELSVWTDPADATRARDDAAAAADPLAGGANWTIDVDTSATAAAVAEALGGAAVGSG